MKSAEAVDAQKVAEEAEAKVERSEKWSETSSPSNQHFDRFGTEHDIDFRNYFNSEVERLKPLAADELIELDDTGITVTARGRLLLRNIAMVFDRHMAEHSDGKRFSKAI